jgi:transposase, IS5 family
MTAIPQGRHRGHREAHRFPDPARLCRQGIPCHNTENPRRVFISGQKRGVFGVIKRELRRRSAVEPVIGHLKAEGHLGRCYLKGRAGDAANAILSAVGYNFRRILAWLRLLLRQILNAIMRVLLSPSTLNPAC